MMRTPDTLHRFLFEHAAIRGNLVYLDASWRTVLSHREYPAPLRDALGELMAAATLLSATIKFSGSLIMQIQGAGPVDLIVVECTSERQLRATANWSGDISQVSWPELVGSGKLVMTIDPIGGKERYQGIVSLEGGSVAQALEEYLQRSEQLDSRLWLAADGERASGMLLQRLPRDTHEDDDVWERAELLAETLTAEELTTLAPAQLLHRLFNEDDVRVFEPEPVCFRCRCSRERVADMLRMLGAAESASIVAEQGQVSVDCEFCHQRYVFDAVDVEQIFAASASPPSSSTRH